MFASREYTESSGGAGRVPPDAETKTNGVPRRRPNDRRLAGAQNAGQVPALDPSPRSGAGANNRGAALTRELAALREQNARLREALARLTAVTNKRACYDGEQAAALLVACAALVATGVKS